MANIKSFPNNQDVYIGAEDVMKWLHGRSSGVFGGNGNASVSALINPSMAVNVADGVGWITNINNDGVVWWNDSMAVNGEMLTLQIDPADGVLNRIDRVIVEWQTTNYVAYPEIKILKGALSSTAVAPSLTNNSTIRQISLARINIDAGTTTITASMITDERLDPSVCGLVTDQVSIDTSTMHSQFEALLKAIQEELSSIEAGTGVEMAKKQFTNTVVPKTLFISNDTYEDFPYRAAVPLSGVIESMIPEVVMGVIDAMSGNFAPISETFNGGIYLYAADIPEDDITIPTILCWKGNVQ